jgi:hypothetical protein
VCKLGKREPLNPIVLLIITERSKVLLELVVELFCLTVGLRVVRGAHGGLDA